MLDLEALVGEMDRLADDVVASAKQAQERRQRAVEQVQEADGIPHLRSVLESLKVDMALPVVGRPMSAFHPYPVAEEYTILATDGSQIAPDYHHIAPWYVVNVGSVVLRHGGPVDDRKPSILHSQPILFPPRSSRAPADAETDGEESAKADAQAAAVVVRGRLEVDRLEAELRRATQLIHEEADPDRSVLLLDGPLIQWRMILDLRPDSEKQRIIDAFRDLLGTARSRRVAIAGYISRSRAVEWITVLRFSMCPQLLGPERSLCDPCKASVIRRYDEPPPDAHHIELSGMRDVELAGKLLTNPGDRSEILELRSAVWKESTGDDGTAGFFYLNTGPQERGGEIARIETPRWVWDDPELLDRLHAALWDQCDAGHGYPMVLSEAHEAAVVRGADRDAFYMLIERLLTRHGVDGAGTSAKATSKRRPMA